MLQFMGSQRVGHNLATERQQVGKVIPSVCRSLNLVSMFNEDEGNERDSKQKHREKMGA